MNTHRLQGKFNIPSWRGALLRGHLGTMMQGLPRPIKGLAMTRWGTLAIILSLIPLSAFLTSCGRKLPPKPSEGATITYPRPYPNPDLDEWGDGEACPPVEPCGE